MLIQYLVHCGLRYLLMFALYLLIEYKTTLNPPFCDMVFVDFP